MELIVGTFEGLLLGYKLKEENEKFSLELSFTNHSHLGAVKSVAISSCGVLASGSSDESIHLFHLKQRVEFGSLLFHEGSLNCLQFFESSHLFSGSEDGKIAIWQAGSWERQKMLIGHKEAVYSFSVHPSGKLGLSVGKDKTLHMWDLIHGRRGFVINTKQVAEQVLWSLNGSKFVVVFDTSLDVYLTETANVIHQISPGFKISTAAFVKSDILAVSGASGVVKFYNTETGRFLSELNSNTKRVKSLVAVTDALSSNVFLVTASSDGFIKIFKIVIKDDTISGDIVAEVQTDFRLICCAAFMETSLVSSVSEPDASASAVSTSPRVKPVFQSKYLDQGTEEKRLAILKKKEKLAKLKKKELLKTDISQLEERKKKRKLSKRGKTDKLKQRKAKGVSKNDQEVETKKKKVPTATLR